MVEVVRYEVGEESAECGSELGRLHDAGAACCYCASLFGRDEYVSVWVWCFSRKPQEGGRRDVGGIEWNERRVGARGRIMDGTLEPESGTVVLVRGGEGRDVPEVRADTIVDN